MAHVSTHNCHIYRQEISRGTTGCGGGKYLLVSMCLGFYLFFYFGGKNAFTKEGPSTVTECIVTLTQYLYRWEGGWSWGGRSVIWPDGVAG